MEHTLEKGKRDTRVSRKNGEENRNIEEIQRDVRGAEDMMREILE